jgi:hypothetical protein
MYIFKEIIIYVLNEDNWSRVLPQKSKQSRGLGAGLRLLKIKAGPKPSTGRDLGPAGPGLFGPGRARLAA